MRLQETTGACLRSMRDGPCDYRTARRIDMTIVMVLLLLPVNGYAQLAELSHGRRPTPA